MSIGMVNYAREVLKAPGDGEVVRGKLVSLSRRGNSVTVTTHPYRESQEKEGQLLAAWLTDVGVMVSPPEESPPGFDALGVVVGLEALMNIDSIHGAYEAAAMTSALLFRIAFNRAKEMLENDSD